MNVLPLPIRLALLSFPALLLAAASAHAQTTADPVIPPVAVHHARPQPPRSETENLNLIVLDPGHGAADNGATFPPENGAPVLEKDVTLALANRIADRLRAQGFTVVLTRPNSTDDVPLEARVELANHARPLACLLLHAANGGHGVHLYTSSLTPPSGTPDPNLIVPWDTAQSAELPQSLRMSADLSTALNALRVPLVTGRVSLLPIDSLTCPAAALEIAPLAPTGDPNTPVTDPAYQSHVAEAVANAMVSWRGHAQSMAAAEAATAAAQAEKAKAAAPRPKPRPPAKPKTLAPKTIAPVPTPPSAGGPL